MPPENQTTAPASQIKVPLLDLKAQYQSIKSEIDEAVARVFESQHFIMGPEVEACEQEIAAYSQCKYGVGVSSGSDALLIALMAAEIGPGDEVITTPYSFFATAGCISRVGAKPVFVDIEPESYNINPDLIEGAITERTKAIIPVHLFGQMAEMDPIMDIAKRHNLVVVEDAAQAIGSEYHGRRAGSIGHYGCFSFFPSKNLGAAGDGGMVVTNDESRAERLRILRVHGSKPKYFHKYIGGNFRLDALQAAIVRVKLRHLDRWTQRRQEIANEYLQALKVPLPPGERLGEGATTRGETATTQVPLPGERLGEGNASGVRLSEGSGRPAEGTITPPTILPNRRHIFNQFVIRTSSRDELQQQLKQADIGTAIYYPRSLHQQECFANLGYDPGDLTESETAADSALTLPIDPELSPKQVSLVGNLIGTFEANSLTQLNGT